MRCCGDKCKKAVAFGVFAILVTLGVVIVVLWNSIYQNILHKELTISNNSMAYNSWKETPIPMYLSFHLFNWTNSEQVFKDWSVKPIFEECGPYVFLEHHSRVNLKWNDNDTITYQQKRIWHYQPELSKGSLDDKITNLNVIAATIAYIVKDRNILIRRGVDFILREKEKSLALTKTANQWIFEGFDDELLSLAKSLNISGMSYDKFGWFYGRNNSETYDGTYTMYTGKKDLELLGMFEEWNGKPYTKFYDSYCGYVNGTSGELWPPVKNYNEVNIFSSDICSSISLSHVQNASIIRGIEGKKYIGTDFLFDNGTKYPEQKCFTSEAKFPSGVRDISKCRFGAPAFISYPHFYLADPSFRKDISGMNPNASKHTFQISLEPTTGVPLNVEAKLQINLLIKPIAGLSMFQNIKQLMIPMLWFEQSATLTPDLASEIKVLLILPSLGTYTGWGFIAAGILIGLISLYITIKDAWKDKESEQLLSEKSL